MYQFDIAIIGAGIIGLSIAAHVARPNRKVLIIEKNDSFGQETSSRNSGVIHAGFYYPEGSLKAKLCVEGNTALYELCRRHSIPFGNPGKLVVARDNYEMEHLLALREQGKKNGVPGLKLISQQELKRLEPNVKGIAALFSKTTGIIDPHALMHFFLQEATQKGAIITYRSEVVGIAPAHKGCEVTIQEQSSLTSFVSTVLVNCAGLNSDKIAGLAGMNIDEIGYRLHYNKGEYFRLRPSLWGLVTRLVYPVPETHGVGLGIHITPGLDAQIRLGPNSKYIDRIDYRIDDSAKSLFYDSARSLIPQLQYDDLQPDFAGIRPKLQGPGEGFRDFVIRHEQARGWPGLVNLIGIESPGLTASPAIGRYVEAIISHIL